MITQVKVILYQENLNNMKLTQSKVKVGMKFINEPYSGNNGLDELLNVFTSTTPKFGDEKGLPLNTIVEVTKPKRKNQQGTNYIEFVIEGTEQKLYAWWTDFKSKMTEI